MNWPNLFRGIVFCVLAAVAVPAAAMTHGEYVARAGDCVACHSVPGGKAFAGGLKMGTPLGNIYATNITPDKETGIGDYTLSDFDNALRRGVARDGHHLYPAMPYPSYAKLTDADVASLYEFFMKEVPPAHQPNRPSEIAWPLNMRWPIALWNVVFMDHGVFQPKASESEAWNRGAYLVQSLGHCGACHTPRGLAWDEAALDESGRSFLAGAMLDFWSAPNLRGDANAGLGRWSKADLVQFFKTGHNRDGAVFGSMIDVINNSSPYMSDADLDAMATYLKSLSATSPDEPVYAYNDATTKMLRSSHPADRGAAVYLGQCVSCHVDTGMGFSPFLPPLAGNPTLLDGDPSSLINIVLNGSNQIVIKGTPDAYRMPQFRINLSDQEIADVVTFIRQGWGNHGSAVTADQVAAMRKATDPSSDQIVILKMR
jgi:alcohol dehydrogenase (quinone), cytochrome c subunit